MSKTLGYSTEAGPSHGRFGRINWREDIGLLAAYILLVGILSFSSPYFFTVRNFLSVFSAVSIIGIISVSATLVIVSGGIDLSIGSIAAFAGVVVAQLSHHVPIPIAVGVAMVAGIVVGLVNGAAITGAGINSLITTLATLSIVRGLAFAYSSGLTQGIRSEAFGFLGRGFIFGVPFSVVVMAILFVAIAWIMGWTIFGRSIYAIGGNARAARLAGIPVKRAQMTVYALSGLSAAIGGVFLASQLGAAAPQAAIGLELNVIAAVILGGSSLSGGKGTVWGTLLGVLIMGTLNNGLNLLNVPSYFQDVARGTVLLLAVGLDQFRIRMAARN